VLNCLHTYLISGMAKDVQDDLNFDSGLQYGLLVGPMFVLAKTISAAPIGKLLEISNRMQLLSACVLVWSLAVALSGFAQNYQQLLLLRIIQGVAESGCVPIGQSLLFDIAPPGTLGTAMAIYNTGVYIGFGLAIGAGANFSKIFGWRTTFIAAGLLGIPYALLLAIGFRDPAKVGRGTVHAPMKMVHRTATSDFVSTWLTSPGLLLLCLGCALRNSGGTIWGYNMSLFYQERGVPVDVLAEWLSWLPMVAGVIGSLLGGFFGDKVIKWAPDRGRLFLLVFSCALSAPLMALALILPAPYCFLCLIPGYAAAEMWLGVAMTIMVGLVPDHMRTSSVALYLFIVDNLGSIGLLVVAPVRVEFGTLYSMLALVPGVYLLSGVIFYSIQPLVSRDIVKAKLANKTIEEDGDAKMKEVEIPNEETPIIPERGFTDEIQRPPRIGVCRQTRSQSAFTPRVRLRRRTRAPSFVDVLDMVQVDVCWHRGHQCMTCTCTRPCRF